MKYQLTGEFECKIDAKGRIKLPSLLIKSFGRILTEFTINRGFEKHLMLYPNDVWEHKTKEINQLNIYNSKHRQAIRYFYRGATQIKLDGSDRILMPKSLMEYAAIDKEVILFAYQDQIEIWSKQAYKKMCEDEPDDFAQIANEIFGFESEGFE